MREQWRILAFALGGSLGAFAYTCLVVFADHLYFSLFLDRAYKADWIDSLAYSFPLGAVMGIISTAAWWSYQSGDFQGASKICNTWGMLTFVFSGALLLLILNDYSGRGYLLLLAQFFRFCLGWGAPFGWSICLLIAPHLPMLWNQENRL